MKKFLLLFTQITFLAIQLQAQAVKKSNPSTKNEKTESNQKYLLEIRTNFKKINSIKQWTNIKSIDLFETSEGGTATYYFLNGNLNKIVTKHYNENSQLISEYYLLNSQLSFVFEKRYQYNRPIYYDVKAMKENKDTEVFNINQSIITETRSYFKNGKILLQLKSQEPKTINTKEVLMEEQHRIKEQFNNLQYLLEKG